MDWLRVVEVFDPAGNSRGSGYLLAGGLVLTARHVVSGNSGAAALDRAVQVRGLKPDADGLPGAVGEWIASRVAWCGVDADLALLVPANGAASFGGALPPLALGRLTGRGPVPVDALGFPRAVSAATHSDTLHLRAAIDPLSQVRADSQLLQDLTPQPGVAELWQGMSGAAVFAGDRLVGVIELVPGNFDATALRAVPVARLLDHDAARGVLQATGVELLAVSVDAGYVAALPRDGRWEDLRAAYTRTVVTNFCRLDRAGFSIGGDEDDRLPALQAFAAQRLTSDEGKSGASLRAARLTTEKRAVVLGNGGAGKSTVLKQTLARAATAQPSLVPVWVPVAQLPREGPLTTARLIEHLVEQARAVLGIGEVRPEFFTTLFAGGQAVLGFDALDEAGSLPRAKEVTNLIRDAAQLWPKCRLVVTSRPEAFRQAPLSTEKSSRTKPEHVFARFDLQPFGRDDIAEFLAGAFQDGAELAGNILHRTGIEALLGTPLTLTLVALAVRVKAALPATRTELFKLCFDTVCATWDEAKGGAPADGLSPAQRLEALRCLAWAAQEAAQETLEEPAARAALARSDEKFSPAQIRQILEQLGRRSLVLRPELGPGGIHDLRALGFAHPQFREYLAGVQLAERFARDPASATKEMEARWLDARWLEVLRFATASLNPQPKVRDAMLRAVLDANDPYRDLLSRPEFVAAALLERPLPGVDGAIVERVTKALEQVIDREDALRVSAAGALVRLNAHPAARPAIARLARGVGGGAELRGAVPGVNETESPLQIRLRAIAELARYESRAVALQELARVKVAGASAEISVSVARAELGERTEALAVMRRWLRQPMDPSSMVFEPFSPDRFAEAMDRLHEGATLNTWLVEDWTLVHATPGLLAVRGDLLKLGFERGVFPGNSPVWDIVFNVGTEQFARMDPASTDVPLPLAHLVYFATSLFRDEAPPAAQRFLEAAVLHPEMTWYVAPYMARLAPGKSAVAIEAMMRFVTESGLGVDVSRINGVLHGIAQEPNDELAVPALLRILREAPRFSQRVSLRPVLISLGRRERGAEVMAILRELMALPESARDLATLGHTREVLSFAVRNFPGPAFALLDGLYRPGGKPADEARALVAGWEKSAVGAADRWFSVMAATTMGREFLDTLANDCGDGPWRAVARQALGEAPAEIIEVNEDPPETLEQLEAKFAEGLPRTKFDEPFDFQVHDGELAQTIGKIADLGGRERGIERARAWLNSPLPTDSDGTPIVGCFEVSERLRALVDLGLRDPEWLEFAATTARRTDPDERGDLITWLRDNA